MGPVRNLRGKSPQKLTMGPPLPTTLRWVLGPSATSGLDYPFLAEKAPGTDTHV